MKNEIRLIDANAAIEALAANFRQASVDGCDNPFYQVAEDTISEMPTVCGDHFTNLTKTVKLSLEHLKKMDGKLVKIGDAQSKIAENAIVNVYASLAIGKSGVTYLFEHYGKTWYAYTYPPAHIDREAWTTEWVEGRNCNS